MGLFHFGFREGAFGIAVAQPEGLAAGAGGHLGPLIAIEEVGLLQQGLARLADRRQ